MNNNEKVKEIVLSLGADVCGIAGIGHFSSAPKGFSPIDIYEGCKSVICFGIALPKGIFDVNPRLIYSHFNETVACQKVDEIAFYAAKKIEKEFGCDAIPMPADAPNEYWNASTLTAKGLISMKHTAVVCGIGQLGKNTLLLNPEFGNRLTLGAVFTDYEFESDEPCENICIEGCKKCMEACPVQAIHDGHVEQKLCRTNSFHKTARGFDTVDCNCCRRVCPMRYGKGR